MRTILLATAGALALSAGAAQADFTLTILHTNDVHDRFEPITATGSTCAAEDDAAGKCFGGMARLVTAVTQAKDRAVNPLLLDAGDWYQGTLFYTQYKHEAAAEFIGKLGYGAMAVGNHEFDDGPAELAALADAVDVPILAANMDATSEPLLADKIAPHAVVEVGGQKVGIIGLTPESNPELSSPGPNVHFQAPIAVVQAQIDALTGQGIDKIILLSHSGYLLDQQIADHTSGLDVIVGGHSHTLLSNIDPAAAGPYPTRANGVPIVTAESYTKYLGELVVTFDDQGRVTKAEGAPILLDASVAPDPATVERVAALAAPLAAIRAEVVGQTRAPIDGSRETCRVRECTMGNLVADAQLARVADQGVQIALVNGGGLRASIDQGEVSMGDVLTVLPFLNTLSTFEVTGADLLAALENGVSQMEEGGGRFPQVAGFRYTVDPAAPVGSRISDAVIGDAPLDPAAIYLAVSNNYVRNGGDGYAMFNDARNAYDYGPDLAQVVADYLRAHPDYAPYIDGRITVK
ncbi:bifunctional metallophosphatase/5'-nucleotidase [Falsirhodobacter sp. 20TX0035]|uniref:bifunctional metallophosphatase/5'-nucleotidase n=1 Tax=Falsirhodobacter sp. 20TX0035 TaxID=3022019 RepID=UPI002330FEB9|nr:bifunctional metallophosphatase/5'-nucleotidase [Falsirhodobacter sp. 20TX0035]MDB6452352.1 bifunctional metallophosphatase/5'-nucleotidase [Falsirhodobacter sp. 20TX0035]